ncbi:low molecular weight protein-tyrosine-phosphatase [Vibrio sp. Sgm 5]|uniref:low molecular weight protein-tyrosine-phosphatase n=1 Tax=Vibrio sp. Sgm 5 TaxID=2994387 RepID=UPI002248C4F2|nr:low molecular weight protein-tyrosine-phosphatase [Vibrio sp. Sgm 5]MCX2792886.1 low molecular weight phosphotyrosine protein phosphatase [Vibrio sp. Sgm 5]
MFNKIVVVCVGNICRSPYGEAVLQKMLPEKYISSAGIMVDSSGLSENPANETAIKIASERDIDLTKHKAQQLTKEMCLTADLLLVMEPKHIGLLTDICPEAHGKTMLLSRWVEQVNSISDPHKKSDEMFRHVYEIIDQSCSKWAEKLK